MPLPASNCISINSNNEVIVETEHDLEIGTYHRVPIVDTIEYDLVGQL